MRTVVAALASLVPALASADTADVARHVSAGQELARTGDYPGAIREFEAADQLAPRASHACLIGLAELRRHEAGQAEIRFAQCHARTTAADPLPQWLAASEAELAQELGQLAAVTVVVTPLVADTLVAIDGWDAPVPAGTVHLAPGHYHLAVRAPGHAPATSELDVGDAKPKQLIVELDPRPAPRPAPAEPTAALPAARPTSTRWLVGGAAALAAAAIVDVTAVRITYNHLEDATDDKTYNGDRTAYEVSRGATLALLLGGAAALVIGAVARHDESAPRIGARVSHDTTLLTLEWAR